MFRKIIILTISFLLVGCSENVDVMETPNSENEEIIITQDSEIEIEDNDVDKVLRDYTNAKGCDMSVAFRIYVVEAYKDNLGEAPMAILEKLENHEPILDKDGNEIIMGLPGEFDVAIVDGICRVLLD